MKLKSILLTAAATISLATATMAQVPNYVPTNGLVGWWPFNGNANDESGIGNNGTVNGATLTNDRFGNTNKAYNFDGNDIITLQLGSNIQGNNSRSISSWFTLNNLSNHTHTIYKGGANGTANDFSIWITSVNNQIRFHIRRYTDDIVTDYFNIPINQWHSLIVTYDGTNDLQTKIYLDGQLITNFQVAPTGLTYNTSSVLPAFGMLTDQLGVNHYYNGQLDDIAIWNRELTQQEITDLYNAVNCANNTSITPQSNSLTSGSTATFTASTSDPNPSYVWQSDLGQGFQTLNNFGNYTGTNTGTLNIANVQLPNHTQPVRVITTSGNCIDTSNVAVINILDTCITNVTVYDTLFTTVTDTLVINATITGINPPNTLNTVKVFPNPANTHITIDYGNFNAMSGYTLTIVNSVGQTVFTTPINQQTSYIDLSTWTGNGIYFVQLIDPQNNTIENRKIVIQ